MFELFYMGGPLFMSILTIQFIGVLFFTIRSVTNKSEQAHELIKSMGTFALVTGIFGQLIGLFSAFQAIEQMGSVSPSILSAGLKVSMISTLYGMLIFLISYILWLVIKLKK